MRMGLSRRLYRKKGTLNTHQSRVQERQTFNTHQLRVQEKIQFANRKYRNKRKPQTWFESFERSFDFGRNRAFEETHIYCKNKKGHFRGTSITQEVR